MQDVKEEVRDKLNIEDVIGEYVPLKRSGRSFKGLSPFTSEKTPSFMVTPDKNIWYDFSSDQGGDVFSFIMKVEGLDFRAALELLARKAGVDLSLYDTSQHKTVAKKKQRLLSALDLSANYYQQTLIKNKHALEYIIKKRGFDKQTIQDFRLGYAPENGDALVSFLKKKGYSLSELKDAGLISSRGGDMFRGRIMVPLCDGQGQVIGFTARLLSENKNAPKYINTPQTLLYDKSRHVFGLHQAKTAIRHADYAVITEGNLDVVSSHQAGIRQVVATAGTAITEHHFKALNRLTENIKLAFDGDKAGVAATERAIPIAQKVDVRLSIITLPDGAKDPDELIQEDADKWQQAINAAAPVVDWVLSAYANRCDLETAEGKRVFSTKALTVVSELQDSVEKEHYIEKIAEYTGASSVALKEKMQAVENKDTAQNTRLKPVKAKKDAPRKEGYEDNLLALALIDNDARELLKKMSKGDFESDEQRHLFSFFLKNPQQSVGESIPEGLREIDTYVKVLLLKADARYAAWSAQDRYLEAAKLIRQMQNEKVKLKKRELTRALREAEEAGDEKKSAALRSALNKIIKELGGAK
ncbi:DNA primase [Candidatus Saccharibacteria bacterium]|nr:DNA primase [Candidatus Saccharibacteria bacterium]